MKKSFELEDSFTSLNHIPRSQIQKRKTYNHILRSAEPKRQFRLLFGNWAGIFLTIIMLLVGSGFLYTQIVNPALSKQASNKPADHFAAGKVVMTYLTKSDSEYYFNLKTNVTRPGITILDEEAWMKNINEALNGMAAEEQAPSGEALYDFLVIFEGREPAEFKLWVNENYVYLKHFENGKVYKIDSGQAKLIINTIHNIEEQVYF